MANEYLSRTPSVAGNRKTWTYSFWYKKSKNNVSNTFLDVNVGGLFSNFAISSSDVIYYYEAFSGVDYGYSTVARYRDCALPYHIVLSVDTTQASASNRVKLYVNGVQQTFNQNYGDMPQNLDTYINSTNLHKIGYNTDQSNSLNGYMSDVFLIDGQALSPSVFGQTNSTTGQWEPKSPSAIRSIVGSFGTNGFYLSFSNKASTTTLGYDYKTTDRNSNNDWTPNNISIDDGVVDGFGNTFAVVNPLEYIGTLSDGGLTVSGTGDACSNIPLVSGKWYCEVSVGSISNNIHMGFTGLDKNGMVHGQIDSKRIVYQFSTGAVYLDGTGLSTPDSGVGTYTTGDIIGMAIDCDAGTVKFFKNGTQVYSRTALAEIGGYDWKFLVYTTSATATFNFGQGTFVTSNGGSGYADGNGLGKFQYAPPSGHLALCEDNLPNPTIVPQNHFNTIIYTGTGSAQTITGLNFKPALVWSTSRASSTGYYPMLCDSVRGPNLSINSNTANAEASSTDGTVSSFNSNGFSLNNGGGYNNSSGASYVVHCWKGGSSNVTNTSGSRTSVVSANVEGGFSAVTFDIASSSGEDTVGHGLGAKPDVIMMKCRNNGYNWDVWHKGLGAITNTLILNNYGNVSTDRQPFTASTEPTSNVFSVRNAFFSGGSSFVAYCWRAIPGYSSFGNYVGTNNITFVHTGFRPAFVMIRPYNSTPNTGWRVFDNKRSLYNTNGTQPAIYWENGNTSNEVSQNGVDFMSNGFALMSSSDVNHNQLNTGYIYMAFAEQPFDFANAR